MEKKLHGQCSFKLESMNQAQFNIKNQTTLRLWPNTCSFKLDYADGYC